LPAAYTRRSLYEHSENSSFWAFCVVGNWAQLMWKYMNPDVVALQTELELGFQEGVSEMDAKALKMLRESEKQEKVVEMLTDFSVGAGDSVFAGWKKLFARIVSK